MPSLPILGSREITSATMPNLKPSEYNYFLERADVVWGVNFRSMAFVRLTPGQYERARKLLAGSAPEDEENRSLQKDLLRGQFLVPESFDELDHLKLKNRLSRFGGNGLALVIAPTLRCNFGCEYCYVDLNAGKMSREDCERLKKFFNRRLPHDSMAAIVWTGGDPSLAMDVVEDLSGSFLTSCEGKNCRYEASLITNAYLLDDKMRASLRRSHVSFLQVSLDGSEEFHNKTRHLPNKTSTYQRIMDNVADTCEEVTIYLRINIDRRNQAGITDLLDDIERRGLKQKVRIYFAHVDDVNENSAGYGENCLTVQEYARVEERLIRESSEAGFLLGGRVLTRPVSTFCGANASNYYVVDSKANLLKCYHDLGAAERKGVGRIGDNGEEIITNSQNLVKWMGWDPFEIDECRTCKVLPLCMGGCSHKIMNSGLDVERGCLKLRFTMEQVVETVGLRLSRSQSGGSQIGGCGSCAAAAAMNV
ncbi:MAG TPA: radical SAM protein [Thermoanaerobaculia bacterium]|nr:radical SAM protein [Thermoanaerobaculia bacterium]